MNALLKGALTHLTGTVSNMRAKGGLVDAQSDDELQARAGKPPQPQWQRPKLLARSSNSVAIRKVVLGRREVVVRLISIPSC